MDYFRRLGQLRRRMSRAGLPALVVTHLPDVRYLTGFTGSSAALVVARRGLRLFTDPRYATQAAEEVTCARVEVVSNFPAVSAVQWVAAQPGVDRAGFDATRTTVDDLARWRAALPSRIRRGFFTSLEASPVEALRTLKDADELALMAEAALAGCKLFDRIVPIIRPGIRELDVAAELEHQARLLGAEGMSFETIAASGARSALPHGRATANPLPRRGFLTLDFGVILKGYCSDMTRTVHLGKPTAEERRAYGAVLEAQETAAAAAVAGVRCGDVDEAARTVLRRYDLAEAFTHSTGHGVGLEIHEPPRVGSEQESVLRPGMVITIEPGIYLEGRFGIRIEDMVAVTRTGGHVLTPAPKALIEL
ncbi:MAG: M24 family metallopeptidase [Terracidiphilus sp.]